MFIIPKNTKFTLIVDDEYQWILYEGIITDKRRKYYPKSGDSVVMYFSNVASDWVAHKIVFACGYTLETF